MSLQSYWRKRNFKQTPEPHGDTARSSEGRVFVVQKHAASRLHYDFRLEMEGTLKSWAVPKGPSLDPAQKRLAVHVEDHPIEYADFEGLIQPNHYGAGSVELWDRGKWIPKGDPVAGYKNGKLVFQLEGRRLRGGWTLARMGGRAQSEKRDNWLLIKMRDEEARTGRKAEITERQRGSITKDNVKKQRTWRSTRESKRSLSTIDLARVAGVRRASIPSIIHPQLATLVDVAPDGNEWLHELKLDGYRILSRIADGKAHLFSRNGKDWTDRLSQVARALTRLPVQQAWLDGEVVVLMPNGNSSFQALQNAFDRNRTADLVYFVFDLLYLDGYDMRLVPLLERKRLLSELLDTGKYEPLRYTDHVQGNGGKMYRQACQRGSEGIIAKRADGPYVAGRGHGWLKIKCGLRQEFVIGGYTDPSGSRAAFGALLLGVYDKGGALHYAGRVGTGFNRQLLRQIHQRLRKLEQAKPPFVDSPAGVEVLGVHWVKPDLVGEVKFAEWTHEGLVRQASFQGLREDKPAKSIIRERAKGRSR